MECREIIELLSAHRDGETTPEEAARAEAHLAECGACRVRMADYEAIDNLLVDLPDVKAEPAFAEELSRRKSRPGIVIRLLRPKALKMLGAAAAVLVITISAVVGAGLLGGGTGVAPRPPKGHVEVNLDLLVDKEFLGIGHYDMRMSAGMSSMGISDVYANTEEGV